MIHVYVHKLFHPGTFSTATDDELLCQSPLFPIWRTPWSPLAYSFTIGQLLSFMMLSLYAVNRTVQLLWDLLAVTCSPFLTHEIGASCTDCVILVVILSWLTNKQIHVQTMMLWIFVTDQIEYRLIGLLCQELLWSDSFTFLPHFTFLS